MKTILSIGSAAALVLVAGLSTGCASDPTAVVDKDPTRVICRSEPDTGSRLPKRTCKEAREWEAIAEENQQAKRNMDRGSVGQDAADTSGGSR